MSHASACMACIVMLLADSGAVVSPQVRDLQGNLSFLQKSLGLDQAKVHALLRACPELLLDGAAPAFQCLSAALQLDNALLQVLIPDEAGCMIMQNSLGVAQDDHTIGSGTAAAQ